MILLIALAHASGLDAPAIGSIEASPSHATPAAVYWNPAMLPGMDPTLSVSAAFNTGFVRYTRDRRGVYQTPDSLQFTADLDDAYIDASKSGESEPVTAAIASPAVNGFVAVPVRDELALGAGFYLPYAAPLKFPDDGPQRYALQEAFIVIARIHGAVGYQPTDALSIGAGVAYVTGTASLTKVQDYAGLDVFADGMGRPPINQDTDFGIDAPSEVRELDVLSRNVQIRNATQHGVTFNAGLAVHPSDTLTVTASYDHGTAIDFEGPFALDMNDSFWTGDLDNSGVRFDPLVEGRANLQFRTPMRFRLGTAVDAGSTHIDAMLALVRWSAIDQFTFITRSAQLEQPTLGFTDTTEVALPRDWRDSVHVQLTPTFTLSDTRRLATQLGYQSPASPDSTIDVASPDGHRLLLGSGYGMALGKADLMLDARVQFIAPRTVTTSDSDLGNGRYSLLIGVLGANLEVPL